MNEQENTPIPSGQSSLKPAPTPDFELADKLIKDLKDAHWDASPEHRGMHAYGYTENEQEAIDIVVSKAVELGMEAFSDLAGNMYLIKRGKHHDKTSIIVSHLDTVEKGGAHDGRDGIAAGMAVISGFNNAQITPENDVCVMIARSEESCVNGLVSIGAKLATGKMDMKKLSELKNRKTDRSVLAHMSELGIPTGRLEGYLNANPTLFPAGKTPTMFPTGEHAEHLINQLVEAHIEQGKYCAKQDIEIGIVSHIRGNTRFINAHNTGKADHSGGAFEEDRADAVRAYNKLMHYAEEWFETKRAEGHDLVYTPAVAITDNESATTIADYIRYSFEIRSTETPLLEEFSKYMQQKAQELMDKHPNKDLAIRLPKPVITDPAAMHEQLIEHTKHIARSQGIRTGVVTSGAGHDTVQFANSSVPSVMLFIRQDDPLSHNPDEARDRESFKNACRIISGMIMNPPPLPEKHTVAGKDQAKSFTDYIQQQGAQAYNPGQWRK